MTITSEAAATAQAGNTDYSFVVRLNRAPTDEEIDRLYEVGLDDALLGGIDMYVTRSAPNLPTAVGTVVGQLTHIPGLYAVGVAAADPDDYAAGELELLDLLDSLVRARTDRRLSIGERSLLASLLVDPAGSDTFTYQATVVQVGPDLFAEVLDLPGVKAVAHGVDQLRSDLLDAVVVAANLPKGVMPDIRLHLASGIVDPPQRGAFDRVAALDARAEVETDTPAQVRRLLALHWSEQQVADVLGITPERVAELHR